MIEATEIPSQDSQFTETEMDAQTSLDHDYPILAKKVKCQFLNLSDNLKVKLTGSLDLTGFSNLKGFAFSKQKVTSLNLQDCPQLESLACWGNELTELDLSNCSQLKGLNCYDNKLTNLDLSSCENLEYLDCSENQLTQLDLRQNKKLTELYCGNNQLVDLEIKSPNLTKLCCYDNQLSTLDLINCFQLTELWCQWNQLTQITFPPQLPNLEKLGCFDNFLTNLDWVALNGEKLILFNLQDNYFPPQDLSCLAMFTNLKELFVGNKKQAKIKQGIYNRWTGSLQPLQNMKQLHSLSISNTDIASGTEYLPTNVMEIYCSCTLRPDSKVSLIVKALEQNNDFIPIMSLNKIYLKKKLNSEAITQLNLLELNILSWFFPSTQIQHIIPGEQWREHYKRWGLCTNCQQLNGYGGWCQSCNLPHLQANFANWTSGNLELDKLIQKCQLESRNGRNLLEWIPYESFSNIEYLAKGGFSKIYKATWTDGPLKGWNVKDNKWNRYGTMDIVLKILDNSQNTTTEFLQEIINHKSVTRDSGSFIVDCYGISREPETSNYVMVIQYWSGGNLRQFLQSNYWRLSFKDRFDQLFGIVQGLTSIHQANLVHRDLHAGNVLNLLQNGHVSSFITDMGLSRPANETNKNKLYGVLPYVAHEVLRGKKYTPAADIYSLGMLAYELFSGKPPFVEYARDPLLTLRICEGLRPNLAEVIAPQLLKDLISHCWDAIPEQRPIAGELICVLGDWLDKDSSIKKHTKFYHQYQELLEIDAFSVLTNKPHLNYQTNKFTTSKPLDFKNSSELAKNKELNEKFRDYSEKTLEFDEIGLTLKKSSETSSQIEANKEKNKQELIAQIQAIQTSPKWN